MKKKEKAETGRIFSNLEKTGIFFSFCFFSIIFIFILIFGGQSNEKIHQLVSSFVSIFAFSFSFILLIFGLKAIIIERKIEESYNNLEHMKNTINEELLNVRLTSRGLFNVYEYISEDSEVRSVRRRFLLFKQYQKILLTNDPELKRRGARDIVGIFQSKEDEILFIQRAIGVLENYLESTEERDPRHISDTQAVIGKAYLKLSQCALPSAQSQ